MIWTFTPNPALDITWQAPDQTRGQVHRIRRSTSSWTK